MINGWNPPTFHIVFVQMRCIAFVSYLGNKCVLRWSNIYVNDHWGGCITGGTWCQWATCCLFLQFMWSLERWSVDCLPVITVTWCRKYASLCHQVYVAHRVAEQLQNSDMQKVTTHEWCHQVVGCLLFNNHCIKSSCFTPTDHLTQIFTLWWLIAALWLYLNLLCRNWS